MIDYEHVENRRIELMRGNETKLVELRAKIAESRQRIADLRRDEVKLPSTQEEWERENARKAEANRLQLALAPLITRDLPALEHRGQEIQCGNFPELITLSGVAFANQEQAKADAARKAANDLVSVRAAWNEHVATLSTAKTVALARALVKAAATAQAPIDPTADALLAGIEPVAA